MAPENPPYEQVQASIEETLRFAGFTVDNFVLEHQAELERCTSHDQVNLIVRVALTFAYAHGLITAGPDTAYEQWLAVDLPEPYAGVVAGKLRESIGRMDSTFNAEVRKFGQ